MFRIGGSAGTGITSGLNRPGYQNPLPAPVGSTKERLLRAIGEQPSNRNLSRFLTTFGLNLLSQPAQGSGFGGLLSTAATAAKRGAAGAAIITTRAAAAATGSRRGFIFFGEDKYQQTV